MMLSNTNTTNIERIDVDPNNKMYEFLSPEAIFTMHNANPDIRIKLVGSGLVELLYSYISQDMS
jgi:hypothetical protein